MTIRIAWLVPPETSVDGESFFERPFGFAQGRPGAATPPEVSGGFNPQRDGAVVPTFRKERETWGTLYRATGHCFSEDKFEAELDLAGGEGSVGFQEALGLLVEGGIEDSVDVGGVLHEGGGFDGEAVGGDFDALVVAVEEVEGVGGELQAIAVANVDFADEAKIGGSVVGSGEAVAAVAGETVVVVVAVLVGIAVDGGVDGASAAGGDDAGDFPVVENVAEELVLAVEGTRLDGEGGDEAVALVGDAGAALGIGVRRSSGRWRARRRRGRPGRRRWRGRRCRKDGDRCREPCGG